MIKGDFTVCVPIAHCISIVVKINSLVLLGVGMKHQCIVFRHFSSCLHICVLLGTAQKYGIEVLQKSTKHHFPVAILKKRRKYMATVTQGEAVTLQAPDSDVSLSVPKGVKSVIVGRIHTNYTRFKNAIPNDECIIGPMVEFHSQELGAENIGHSQYRIKIPHCVKKKEHLSAIRVRCGDIYKPDSFREIENKIKTDGSSACYEVDDKFITIHADHFSNFICTSCSKVCDALIVAFLFGYLVPVPKGRRTAVKVKSYLCSSLYKIKDFQTVRVFKLGILVFPNPVLVCIV